MMSMGFRHLKSDLGIFALFSKDGIKVIIIVYVNDAIFMGPNKCDVSMAKDLLMQTWECHNMGNTEEFLHMRIQHQRSSITLDQKDYLQKVLEWFNMHNAKSVLTP